MNEIVIREADKKDLKAIYGLVQELASYENAASQLKIDLKYYEEQFSANTFSAIVAEMDQQVVGTCIFYLTFSTWKGRMLYLEDFVVSEKHRQLGIGQKLYDQFLIEARNRSCTMVKWQVLDWNEPAIAFYEKNHATIEKGWWNVKIIFDN